MRLRSSELAAAVGGRVEGPDVTVDGATIDSRQVRPGQLFVAVVADRDGHDFVGPALQAGAAAYLTAREPVGGTAIVVEDTGAALQRAGRLARERLAGPVVGITGSVGKTSVKDLLAGILVPVRAAHASERSFNNELGVPLTLLDAPDGTEVTVVEMGARGIGHVAELCAIAAPTIGVVTRVAAAHTEVFGSLENVARAKGELPESLPSSGVAVLFSGDRRVLAMASRTQARVLAFGPRGDVVAEHVVLDDDLRCRFTLQTPWGSVHDVHLGTLGLHQVDNALAAAAAALACGLEVEDVADGLTRAELSPWRMELAVTADGARVLNDAYNANPTSMEAALRSLAALPATRRHAVLGVMAELGDVHHPEHARLGALARELGIRVVAVGTSDYGGDVVVRTVEEAVDALGDLGPEDAVLVKGSRVAGLEAVAEQLLES